MGKDSFYARYIKRLLDILFALILAVPALPIVTVCYLAIKLGTKGPAFFTQRRPGKDGKIFVLFKLRTMIVDTERDGKSLSDMERTTRIGRVIRKCSFDELPQLYNVLKGDMSLIGPRPLLPEYLPLYSAQQARRHEVRPGISGWAQVNGRNELTWEEKFDRDVWYVDHVSFALDVRILFMTIVNVLRHTGINAGVGETMGMFKGNKTEV